MILKATLANINGVVLAAKYVYGPMKFYGGYEYAVYSPPSDSYPGGFTSLGGYTVLPGAVNVTNYIHNKHLQVAWVGAKYALRSDLDIAGSLLHRPSKRLRPARGEANGVRPQHRRRHSRRNPARRAQFLLRGRSAGRLRPARLSSAQANRPLCGHDLLRRLGRHSQRLYPQQQLRAHDRNAFEFLSNSQAAAYPVKASMT